ncbi:MAG: methionyl-tRNA formyltransferase [Sphingobacteriaceae bacterium]|nr:methionyl-tRNA formyltransferase [Sphingobacteriaceae bacterium]
MSSWRIVFIGTPDFAVESLRGLLQAGHNVVGVVTAPDKPAGRGQKLSESAVKQYAQEQGLPILQPLKLKDPEFIAQLSALKPDLQVIVAFRMLPETVWNLPPQGTLNVHGSLLPNYRGAAPINWAILNGEKETGVSTFKLQHEIDTGDILLQEKMSIGPNETAGELHDRMKVVGAQLLVKTLQELANGTLSASPQQLNANTKHAPKLFKTDCEIDWYNTSEQIHNQIRGLSPYPTAYTVLGDKTLKIFSAEIELGKPEIPAGTFSTDHKSYLKFAATDGYLSLKEVQLEGKKKMGIDEFLRGIRL